MSAALDAPGLDAVAVCVTLLCLQRALSQPLAMWAFMLLWCAYMVYKTTGSA